MNLLSRRSMKLSIINGSPRGKNSNTKLLVEKFLEGFSSVDNNFELKAVFLKTENDKEKLIRIFTDSDILIIAFPLYTDAMPGIVKEYFESLSQLRNSNPDLRLGFIVQSGFPESYHSSFLSKYLKKLANRLGVQYLGTAIRGGIEGIKVQPKWMTRKTYELLYDLGQHLALEWEYNPELLNRMAKPGHLKGLRLQLFKLMGKLGIANFYWNSQLKKNKAFDIRYAQPYYQNK